MLSPAEQVRQLESQAPQVVSLALNWLLVQVVHEFGVGAFGFTLLVPQFLQSLEVPPEQVAQSAWQLAQVETVALYWLLGQVVQGPAAG